MWLYFCKYIMMPADRRKIELIYIFRKTQHFNFHKLWYLFFVLYNFALIVFNNAWIVPDFCEQFIFINFYSVVLRWIIILIWKKNHSFLVVMYMYPNVKTQKTVCTSGTKIFDSINNCIHHQEVEDGYIFA